MRAEDRCPDSLRHFRMASSKLLHICITGSSDSTSSTPATMPARWRASPRSEAARSSDSARRELARESMSSGTTVEHGGQGGDEKGKSDSGGMVGLLAHGALKVPELLENGIELSVEGREAAGDCGEHVACRAGLVELPEHGRNEKRLNAGTLKVFLENLPGRRSRGLEAPRRSCCGTTQSRRGNSTKGAAGSC